MQTLYKAIAELRKTRIVENSSLVANEKAWSLMDEDMQEIFMTCLQHTLYYLYGS